MARRHSFTKDSQLCFKNIWIVVEHWEGVQKAQESNRKIQSRNMHSEESMLERTISLKQHCKGNILHWVSRKWMSIKSLLFKGVALVVKSNFLSLTETEPLDPVIIIVYFEPLHMMFHTETRELVTHMYLNRVIVLILYPKSRIKQ